MPSIARPLAGAPARRLASLCFATLLLGSCAAGPEEAADHLFVGDHILTMEAEGATAVAVTGDTIVWVGDRAEADAWRGPDTEVHQLGDRALLPGFVDAHGHLTFTARTIDMANVSSPPVGPVENIADLQATVGSFIEERAIAAGDWVVGMGYDDSLLAEQRHPTRTDLDAVSAEHPIALTHVSGHLAALNSAALDIVGYTAETPDPPGGHLRREADGKTPNGVLEETALQGVYPHTMGALEADQVRRALYDYASYGVTTVQDGGATTDLLALLGEIAASDEGMPLDVVAYQRIFQDDEPLYDGLPVGEEVSRLKFGGIKITLDGSPQGKTAYLSKPYHVPPTGQSADYAGYPMITEAEAKARVKRFYGEGVQVLAHANGDAASEVLVDAVEEAEQEFGPRDHRTVMIHAQTVREDQLDRMAKLNMVPSFFSAHTFYWGDWHRDSVLGPERGSRISPTRTTHDRGMHFTVHNDTPIVPSDMIRLLWATTNRITRSGVQLGPEHALTVEEAIEAMTLDAAYQSFDEARKGSIAAGKQADLVILSRDPRGGDTVDLMDVQVEKTMSRGTWIYGD